MHGRECGITRWLKVQEVWFAVSTDGGSRVELRSGRVLDTVSDTVPDVVLYRLLYR